MKQARNTRNRALGLRLLSATVGLLAVAAGPLEARAENWLRQISSGPGYSESFNLNLLAGARITDGGEWAPVEQQVLLGVDLDYTGEEWPLGLSMMGTLWYSQADGSAEGVDVDMTTWEAQAGVRKIWQKGRDLQPFVNGGITFLSASADVSGGGSSGSPSDSSIGVWAGGGAYWTLFEWLNLGVDARYSYVALDLGGGSANAGGLQLSVLLGWHWQAW